MTAVAGLPEPSRSAFILRTIHELSYKAIAQRLGISENAAQKRVAKSLIELMAKIGRGGNDAPGSSNKGTGQESRKSDER